MGVISNLMSVHSSCWHLNTATEVDITIAKVIGEHFEVFSLKTRVVEHNIVVDWSSCGNTCSMRNQEEII